MFKVTAILIVVLLCVQGFDTKPADPDVPELNGIAKKISKALKELKHKVDTAFQNEVNFLEGFYSTLNSLGNSTLEKTERDMQKRAKTINDEMREIIKKSPGENVTKCVAEFQPKLIQLSVELTENLEQCINNQLNRGPEIINSTLEESKNVYLKITDLKQQVKECKRNKICLTDLLHKINTDITVLPAEISVGIAKGYLWLDSIAPNIAWCADGKANQVSWYGRDILAELEKCLITP